MSTRGVAVRVSCFFVTVLIVTSSLGPRAQGGLAIASSSSTRYPPDIVRLLDQATFGPTPELVDHVRTVGEDAFLSEQLSSPLTPYPDLPPMPSTRPDTCTGTCQRDNYTMYPLQTHFFTNALSGSDQLRQRVAFALGQIFVVSALNSKVTLSNWMGPYQQLLYKDALGNFRHLLSDVTLNPAMGSYLNVLSNKQLNPTTGAKPNENYAREVLQLFTIGLTLLNQDGSPRLSTGAPIPAYDQATVESFARVFTGWILAPAFGSGIPNYHDPMVQRVTRGVEVDHDRGEKQLLGGEIVPAGLSAAADLDAALENIFNHPNVGPFIGKQLIQHLITSNPSGEYVARVAAVFADNGSGTRGDLAAVIRAILTDPEARGDLHAEPTYGHLVEPVLFITRLLRAFHATSDGVLASYSATMEQDLFRAASVFNFYPPGYRIVGGNGLAGPEFKLYDSATALARINFVNTLVFGSIPANPPDRPTGTTIDLSSLVGMANNPELLIDELNGLLLHQSLTPAMHDAILGAITAIPASNPTMRAKTAAYLVGSSSAYQVER
ncbi:MAG: DUF1800 domain-containing protein [Acidobacteriota bacterium]